MIKKNSVPQSGIEPQSLTFRMSIKAPDRRHITTMKHSHKNACTCDAS